MVDPFTGSSSYRSAQAQQQQQVNVQFKPPTATATSSKHISVKHFPLSKYMTFSTCDPAKVLLKIR